MDRQLTYFRLIVLLSSLLGYCSLFGQSYYRANIPSLLDSLRHSDRLGLQLEAEGFFRDNEYGSQVGSDYTLPGYRFNTNLIYNFRTQMPICLVFGLNHIYYHGANKYPSAIAYTDLPYWSSGDGYTPLRLKPSFQVSIQPHSDWLVLIGNLEGGVKHALIDPLYNPELNLTADQETGLQVKHRSRSTLLDMWVDWRSFIFLGDKHQEAFVSGIHWQQSLGKGFSLELQNISHHRGGVENTTLDTVHSWLTSALGLRYQYRLGKTKLSHEGYALYYMQRGEHYPSDRGLGFYVKSQLEYSYWRVLVDAYWGRGLISVMGIPFVQSIKRTLEFRRPDHTMFYLRPMVSYECKMPDNYSFGTSLGLWIHPTLPSKLSLFAEVYLNISPYFGLLD